MYNWQPIETAPKDGTKIIGMGGGRRKEDRSLQVYDMKYWQGIWFKNNDGSGYTAQCDPLYWISLNLPVGISEISDGIKKDVTKTGK